MQTLWPIIVPERQVMALSSTSPIFSMCGSFPYEVLKVVYHARALSGHARVESLTKHWDMSNRALCSMT